MWPARLTVVHASTAGALPGACSVGQVGAAPVGAFGSTGAAQEQLPGPGEEAKGCGCEDKASEAESGWHIPSALSCLPQPAAMLRSRAEPQMAAEATHPCTSACSLPRG